MVIVRGNPTHRAWLCGNEFDPTESSDDEPIDRDARMNSEGSSDGPECEVGGYLVRGRRTDAWDAIVTLLVTLESEHDRCFHSVMQGWRAQFL